LLPDIHGRDGAYVVENPQVFRSCGKSGLWQERRILALAARRSEEQGRVVVNSEFRNQKSAFRKAVAQEDAFRCVEWLRFIVNLAGAPLFPIAAKRDRDDAAVVLSDF
jgi:hypothetical protein